MIICYCVVCPNISYLQNQSIENSGVALVKRADERNKFFGKKKKISNVRRTSAGEHGKGLTILGTN